MMGSSYQVELKDKVVLYTSFGHGFQGRRTEKIVPSAADWQEFRAALDRIGVWKWKAAYIDRGVRDGTQWGLTISYSDKTLKTNGDNAYPDSKGRQARDPEYTEAFLAYLAAVKKLLHGKSFK